MANTAPGGEEAIRLRGSARPVPIPVKGPDVLDWAASLDTTPVHRSGTLRVVLDYAGRCKPIAVDAPRAGG